MKLLFQKYARLGIVALGLLCLGGGPYGALEGEPDLILRISESAVQQFTEVAFPIVLEGKEKVTLSAPMVGSITAMVPWKAIVRNPKIKVRSDRRTFTADVQVESTGLQYSDKVSGELDVGWDDRQRVIVVKATKAVLKLRLMQAGRAVSGPELDVASRVPEMVMPVQFSAPAIRVGEKQVRVQLTPQITFDEGAILMHSSLRFTPVREGGMGR